MIKQFKPTQLQHQSYQFQKYLNNPNAINVSYVELLFENIENYNIHDIENFVYEKKINLSTSFDTNGNTLIHKVISIDSKKKSEENKLEIINYLYNNYVNPDKPNKNNETPLHLACYYRLELIVKFLLQTYCNSNYQDNTGNTAFHYLLINCIDREIDMDKNIIQNNNTVQRNDIIYEDEIETHKKNILTYINTLNIDFFKKSLEKYISEIEIIDTPKFNIEKHNLSFYDKNEILSNFINNIRNKIFGYYFKNNENNENNKIHIKDVSSLAIPDDSDYGIIKQGNINHIIMLQTIDTIKQINKKYSEYYEFNNNNISILNNKYNEILNNDKNIDLIAAYKSNEILKKYNTIASKIIDCFQNTVYQSNYKLYNKILSFQFNLLYWIDTFEHFLNGKTKPKNSNNIIEYQLIVDYGNNMFVNVDNIDLYDNFDFNNYDDLDNIYNYYNNFYIANENASINTQIILNDIFIHNSILQYPEPLLYRDIIFSSIVNEKDKLLSFKKSYIANHILLFNNLHSLICIIVILFAADYDDIDCAVNNINDANDIMQNIQNIQQDIIDICNDIIGWYDDTNTDYSIWSGNIASQLSKYEIQISLKLMLIDICYIISTKEQNNDIVGLNLLSVQNNVFGNYINSKLPSNEKFCDDADNEKYFKNFKIGKCLGIHMYKPILGEITQLNLQKKNIMNNENIYTHNFFKYIEILLRVKITEQIYDPANPGNFAEYFQINNLWKSANLKSVVVDNIELKTARCIIITNAIRDNICFIIQDEFTNFIDFIVNTVDHIINIFNKDLKAMNDEFNMAFFTIFCLSKIHDRPIILKGLDDNNLPNNFRIFYIERNLHKIKEILNIDELEKGQLQAVLQLLIQLTIPIEWFVEYNDLHNENNVIKKTTINIAQQITKYITTSLFNIFNLLNDENYLFLNHLVKTLFVYNKESRSISELNGIYNYLLQFSSEIRNKNLSDNYIQCVELFIVILKGPVIMYEHVINNINILEIPQGLLTTIAMSFLLMVNKENLARLVLPPSSHKLSTDNIIIDTHNKNENFILNSAQMYDILYTLHIVHNNINLRYPVVPPTVLNYNYIETLEHNAWTFVVRSYNNSQQRQFINETHPDINNRINNRINAEINNGVVIGIEINDLHNRINASITNEQFFFNLNPPQNYIPFKMVTTELIIFVNLINTELDNYQNLPNANFNNFDLIVVNRLVILLGDLFKYYITIHANYINVDIIFMKKIFVRTAGIILIIKNSLQIIANEKAKLTPNLNNMIKNLRDYIKTVRDYEIPLNNISKLFNLDDYYGNIINRDNLFNANGIVIPMIDTFLHINEDIVGSITNHYNDNTIIEFITERLFETNNIISLNATTAINIISGMSIDEINKEKFIDSIKNNQETEFITNDNSDKIDDENKPPNFNSNIVLPNVSRDNNTLPINENITILIGKLMNKLNIYYNLDNSNNTLLNNFLGFESRSIVRKYFKYNDDIEYKPYELLPALIILMYNNIKNKIFTSSKGLNHLMELIEKRTKLLSSEIIKDINDNLNLTSTALLFNIFEKNIAHNDDYDSDLNIISNIDNLIVQMDLNDLNNKMIYIEQAIVFPLHFIFNINSINYHHIFIEHNYTSCLESKIIESSNITLTYHQSYLYIIYYLIVHGYMPTIYENSELKTEHKMFGITNTHICKYFLNFIHMINEMILPINTQLNNTIQITDDTVIINNIVILNILILQTIESNDNIKYLIDLIDKYKPNIQIPDYNKNDINDIFKLFNKLNFNYFYLTKFKKLLNEFNYEKNMKYITSYSSIQPIIRSQIDSNFKLDNVITQIQNNKFIIRIENKQEDYDININGLPKSLYNFFDKHMYYYIIDNIKDILNNNILSSNLKNILNDELKYNSITSILIEKILINIFDKYIILESTKKIKSDIEQDQDINSIIDNLIKKDNITTNLIDIVHYKNGEIRKTDKKINYLFDINNTNYEIDRYTIKNNFVIFDLLIGKKPILNIKNNNNESPIDLIIKYNNIELLNHIKNDDKLNYILKNEIELFKSKIIKNLNFNFKHFYANLYHNIFNYSDIEFDNIKLSFEINTYITLQYLSESIFLVNDNYTFDDILLLKNIINIDLDKLFTNDIEKYVHKIPFDITDNNIIIDEYIKLYEIEHNNQSKNIYTINDKTIETLYIKHKSKETLQKNTIDNKIQSLKNAKTNIKSVYNIKNKHYKIIKRYEQLNGNYHNIIKLWDEITINIATNSDDELLLLKILNSMNVFLNKDIDKYKILNKALYNVNNKCKIFFENDEYTNLNKTSKFVEDLLIYLSKLIIGTNIIHDIKKKFVYYYTNNKGETIINSLKIINYIFNHKINTQHGNSITDYIYNTFCKNIVKKQDNIHNNINPLNELEVILLADNYIFEIDVLIKTYLSSISNIIDKLVILWKINIKNIFEYFLNLQDTLNMFDIVNK